MPPSPTRREVLIVLVLLIGLIYFFSRDTALLGNPSVLTVPLEDHSDPLVTTLVWSRVPESKILAHVPGWTIFDRLYMRNGVVYIVTDHPEKAPNVSMIYSKGVFVEPGLEAELQRLPTDKEIRMISTAEATNLFGSSAAIIDGVTWLCNDPPQFITHYYHWSAELWFGWWRAYSSLDPHIPSSGTTNLPPPKRLMFSRLDAFHWRDYADMNQWVVRSSFPGVQMEFKDDWRDRSEMNRTWVFERVVIADRSAAMLAYNYARFQRTAAAPFGLPGSLYWWNPIRNKVVEFAGIDPKAHADTLSNHETISELDGFRVGEPPVITYISRQNWGRRMLIPADHERLVSELYKLRDTYGYEVNVVDADKLTRREQIRLAARTTVMLGVHGNGLTALVWMNPNPRSTVMEFFFPQGLAHDYEYTARAMGIIHYGFWGDKHFTSPALPVQNYPEGFQGNSIPIDGKVVADLIVHRLSLNEELDD